MNKQFLKLVAASGALLILLLSLAAVLSPLFLSSASAQPNPGGRTYQVTGQALPTSAGSPTVLQGGSTNTNVNVYTLILANKDSASHTVTVRDCQSPTPFYLFNSYTIAAGSTWVAELNGVRFTGCLQWASDSTNVWGSIIGTR